LDLLVSISRSSFVDVVWGGYPMVASLCGFMKLRGKISGEGGEGFVVISLIKLFQFA
jgi:hypothetical protein